MLFDCFVGSPKVDSRAQYSIFGTPTLIFISKGEGGAVSRKATKMIKRQGPRNMMVQHIISSNGCNKNNYCPGGLGGRGASLERMFKIDIVLAL